MEVPADRLGMLVLFAVRYGLNRPTWAFESVCRAVEEFVSVLGPAERTLLAEELAAHQPPPHPLDARRLWWERAARAVGMPVTVSRAGRDRRERRPDWFGEGA